MERNTLHFYSISETKDPDGRCKSMNNLFNDVKVSVLLMDQSTIFF